MTEEQKNQQENLEETSEQEESAPPANVEGEELNSTENDDQNESESEGEEPAEEELSQEPVTLTADEYRELEKKVAMSDDYLYNLQKTKADLANYQKRAQKEQERSRTLAVKRTIEDLLVVFDQFDMAMKATKTASKMEDIQVGLEMIQENLKNSYPTRGVTPIEALHQPFDPNVHEAMSQQETDEHEPNTVIAVFQKGYKIKDMILRPTKVIVAKAVEKAEEAPETTHGDSAEASESEVSPPAEGDQ